MTPQEGMKHTISLLVDHTTDVLVRVVGLFRRRRYVLHNLTVCRTETSSVLRMIVVAQGDPNLFNYIIGQLNRLIEVIRVNDLTSSKTVERELALIKLSANSSATRMEVMEICSVFRAKIVDLSGKTVTLEVTGPPDKIDAMLSVVRKYGIREIARTGQAILVRGAQSA